MYQNIKDIKAVPFVHAPSDIWQLLTYLMPGVTDEVLTVL